VTNSASLNVSQVLILEGNTTLIINRNSTANSGSLIISSTSVVEVSPSASSNTPISVIGCVSLKGTLKINISGTGSPSQLKVIDYSCQSGIFEHIQVVGTDPCNPVTQTRALYGNSSMMVLFTYEDVCNSQDNQIFPGISSGASIGIIVVILVVLLAIIATIALVSVPSLRKRLFPHRDKTTFAPTTRKASI
jgi:hypothetical protein